jgi:hypothetical protein
MQKNKNTGHGELSVKISYLDGAKMSLSGMSFKQIVIFVSEDATKHKRTPLLMVFSTGKKLYYDDDHVRSFVAGSIDQMELVENCECEGIYRNNTRLKMENGEELEEGGLWTKKNNYVFLVDKDQGIYCPFDSELFIET